MDEVRELHKKILEEAALIPGVTIIEIYDEVIIKCNTPEADKALKECIGRLMTMDLKSDKIESIWIK